MKAKAKSKSKPKPKPKPQNESPTTTAIASESPSEFAFAVARIAVSQICQSTGFKSAQLSALQTLTAVAAKYLQTAAKSSAALAAAAGRTDSNLFDVAAALQDLRSGPALSGASAAAADHCPLKSTALPEIADFASSTPETPFAKPVPPRRRHCQWRPDSAAGGDNAGSNYSIQRPPHVPHWLPEVPETTTTTESERCRGGGGEELWENCAEGCGTNGFVAVEEERESGGFGEGKLELGVDRERVRFKVGVGLRSGVSKGEKRRVNMNAFKFKKDCVSVIER